VADGAVETECRRRAAAIQWRGPAKRNGTTKLIVNAPPAQKSGPGGNYSVAHANLVIAYTKDNLAHVIYPGGVSKDDWVHDLPLLVNAKWSAAPDQGK
jgi:hypothetical protein